jgi:predicted ATPase
LIGSESLLAKKSKQFGKASVWNTAHNGFEEIPLSTNLSVLSQAHNNGALGALSTAYGIIRLYREWSFGRNSIFRTPQPADLRNDRLEPDFSNLGMFLSRLRKDPPTKRALIAALQELYEGITDFEVITEGGTVQIFFTEGNFSIPAKRLSDGTLRYLCLVALLLDPTPPPLICIEEPELGLHPDIMPQIANLLVDASKRTQLVVTTHSDILVDALSEQPESILVCEKHEGQTEIKRLKREELAHWLSDYSLGQLWMRGEIGGKRW